MSKNVITTRYAKAMIAGLSGAQLESLSADIKSFAKLVEETELKQAIASPLVSKTALKNVFEALFKKAKLHDRLQGLALALVENRRTQNLPQILAAAQNLMAQLDGKVEAQVKSATALSSAEQEAIAKALSTRLGKHVGVQNTVDQTLIGGTVIRVGDLQIDDSVKTKLERLRRQLVGKAA